MKKQLLLIWLRDPFCKSMEENKPGCCSIQRNNAVLITAIGYGVGY